MSTATQEKITSRVDREITSELSLGKTGALAYDNVTQIMEVAKLMSVSHVAVPKHLRENPGACLAVAIQSSEWQMSPFAVANKSYVVNDRISYEAQLVNAVILKRAPIVGRFAVTYSGEGNKRRCKVSAVLDGGTVVEYESPEIGSISTKNSPLWKSDPDQQLFYFSSRSLCRRHFPDVLLGVYTPEELSDDSEVRDVTPKPIFADDDTAPDERPDKSATPELLVVEAEEVAPPTIPAKPPHWSDLVEGEAWRTAKLDDGKRSIDDIIATGEFKKLCTATPEDSQLRPALNAAMYWIICQRVEKKNSPVATFEEWLRDKKFLPDDLTLRGANSAQLFACRDAEKSWNP